MARLSAAPLPTLTYQTRSISPLILLHNPKIQDYNSKISDTLDIQIRNLTNILRLNQLFEILILYTSCKNVIT